MPDFLDESTIFPQKPYIYTVKTERHPFEPFLPPGARILFLGSFPPQPHRWCMPFYYPNWINDFWRIMGIIHYADKDHFCIPSEKRFDESAIRAFCADKGLAFYDTACEIRRLRDNASDAFLEVVTPTDIPSLLQRIPDCRTIVTTGQKATEILAEWLMSEPCPADQAPASCHFDQATASCHFDQAKRAETRACERWPQPKSLRIPPVGGILDTHIGPRPIRFWRMPSTSRAYPLPLARKADAYRQLFQ